MSPRMKMAFLIVMSLCSLLVGGSLLVWINERLERAVASSKPEMAREKLEITGLILHRPKNFTVIYTVENQVRMREIAVNKKNQLTITKDVPPDKPMWIKWRGFVNEFGTTIAEYAEVHLHTNSVVQGSLKEE